jgi:TIR domain
MKISEGCIDPERLFGLMPTVIVSYRRSDSRWITGRIVDRLERDLGKGDVFVDIDAIPLGMDFRDHLRNVLDRCDVLLAVIGPNWLTADESGQPRIFEPTDWVRIEIETALARGTPVIPVLIDRAPMPKVSELPESLHAFAFRQAADVDSGRDFHVHMDRLVRAIGQSAAPQPVPGPAAVSEHAPHIASAAVDQSSDTQPGPTHATRRSALAAVVVAAGIAAAAVLLTQRWPDGPAVIPPSPAESALGDGVQVAHNSPLLPTTASPSDQPASLEPAPSLDPPLPLDQPASLDAPVPSDRPVPPQPIEQPQRQRALLFEAENEASNNGLHFNGSVTWRAVKASASLGQFPALTARADIVIPDRQLALTLSLRLNTDPNLPASHTIEVSFNLPAGFAPGGVSNVPAVLMKDTDDSRGVALAGLSAEIRPGVFLIGLSAVDSERVRNLRLLRERAWFDIPIVYSDGARAVLTVEKGAAGDRVFKQAFAAWRE